MEIGEVNPCQLERVVICRSRHRSDGTLYRRPFAYNVAEDLHLGSPPARRLIGRQ